MKIDRVGLIIMRKINSIKIDGYRPFRDFEAHLSPLEVIVGSNGSGKTSLFEFLQFIRDSVHSEIPPEIIPNSPGKRIFHIPGEDIIQWELNLFPQKNVISYAQNNFHEREHEREFVQVKYKCVVHGPVGNPSVYSETAEKPNRILLEMFDRIGDIYPENISLENYGQKEKVELDHANRLILNTIINTKYETLYNLRNFIHKWRFYSSFKIAYEKIRRPVLLEEKPILKEDAGNLSSVLHYLMTEHPSIFEALKIHLRSNIPGFKNLNVLARGAPGEVLAFWQEENINDDLSLADLSDGILRLICWTVLCLHPEPPTLICIDEPDQGIHPRTFAVLAALFQKASLRTQILLTSHSSYFLTFFDIPEIAVMKKVDGRSQFSKVEDSKTLVSILNDFGPEEIESLHRSDELETIA